VEVWLTTSCDRPSVHRPAVNRAARDTPGSLCVAEGTALALPIRQSWAHLLTREAVVAGVSHRTFTLPKRPHLPNEASAIFKSVQLNARPARRLDHARRLEGEIMLQGLRHGPILRQRNFKREVTYADHRIDP